MSARSFVLAAVLASPSFAQTTIHATQGAVQEHLGSAVSGAGDVNADGVADWMAYSTGNGGAVTVFSGSDASILHVLTSPSAAEQVFGQHLAAAGDVDADGHDDLIVSDDRDATVGVDAGAAWIFSGLDGSVLHAFHGKGGNFFGSDVAGVGDVDQDGHADVVISAIYTNGDGAGADAGTVYVYSGLTGLRLHEIHGTKKNQLYGLSVSGAGDVDGDGVPDFAFGSKNPYSARILSGANGELIRTYTGQPNSVFGRRLTAGDFNGDGVPDLGVGAIWEGDRGAVHAFSGADGAELFAREGTVANGVYGWTLSALGDLDGDGRDDLVIGSKATFAEVISGAGGVLYRLHGTLDSGDFYGLWVSCAGDVDGDGVADIVIGDGADSSGGTGAGITRVTSGWNPVGLAYCGPANSNSSGLPAELRGVGSDVVADELLVLTARQLPAGQFGYFLVSGMQGFVQNPGGSQGNLCLAGAIGRYADQVQSSGSAGAMAMRVDVQALPFSPPHAIQPGETWNFQGWFRDANPTATSNFTDGLSVLFQ